MTVGQILVLNSSTNNFLSMVSITHGRPAMVSEHVATVVPFPISNPPQAIGTDKLLGNAVNHALFFVKSIHLYEITHRAIISLYGDKCLKNGGKIPPPHAGHPLEDEEDINTVVRLDRSLTKWESDLPERLRWSQFQALEDKIAQRQTVILQMRFVISDLFSRIDIKSRPQIPSCPHPSLTANPIPVLPLSHATRDKRIHQRQPSSPRGGTGSSPLRVNRSTYRRSPRRAPDHRRHGRPTARLVVSGLLRVLGGDHPHHREAPTRSLPPCRCCPLVGASHVPAQGRR